MRGRRGGAGGELGGAGITRGKHAGAMRGARRAVGCSPTQPQSPRHGELDLPTTEEPSGPTAVPPRGVEPRTMPTIRPTGRHRPTAFSVRRESQLTCVDVVGQFDFQLQSAACSCCSTPASASRRTNLSMMPVKPMVPKKPTPPVKKVETWATFEPPSPPKQPLHFKHAGMNIGAPRSTLEQA